MKNVKQIACASMVAAALLFSPGAMNASSIAVENETDSVEAFLKCEIDEQGFYAKGNCKKVNAAFAEYLRNKKKFG